MQGVIDRAKELFADEQVQKLIEPMVFLGGHAILIYPRTRKGTAVLQKIARGEEITTGDAYRLTAMLGSLVVWVATTYDQTARHMVVLTEYKNRKDQS